MKNGFDQYPIIFTHVPRSAGTSLITILGREYPADEQFYFYVREKFGNTDEALEEFRRLPEERRRRLKLLQGHVGFGLHTHFERYTYITLFREPVSRIVSYYFYILKQPGHYLHNIVLANQMRLEDFVTSGLSTEFDNIQTRQISGVAGVPYGRCTEKMLETAKLNLLRHYAVVGLTERFDETALLMKRHFGWHYPLYTRRHVIKNKPVREQIPEGTVRLIEQTNSLDVALYRFAKKRFDGLIAEQDDSFREEMGRFKKYNAWMTRLSHPRVGDVGIAAWRLYLKLARR